ncbi:uncharacterized protein LOC105848419 isoform X1 [Hydra vulgaris]|uniref:uncharacterized protein LOC105848419 isoform X1 n=1 Tax=Hydra vulgaris TaxID=6087 RepID=UPI0032EA6312
MKFFTLYCLILISVIITQLYGDVYEPFSIKEEKSIQRGVLITTFKSVPKEYEIAFDLKLTSFITYTCANILQFTISSDYSNYGDRCPAAFVCKHLFVGVQICGSVNGRICYAVISKYINLLDWTRFVISQRKFNGSYNYSVQVNGEIMNTVENKDARDFKNVKLYISSPWVIAQPGFIRNMTVTNMCTSTQLYCKPQLNVVFNGELSNYSLNLSLQITYVYEPGELAFNVTWEYFLPLSVTLVSESLILGLVKVDSNRLKYLIPMSLNASGISHSVVTMIQSTSCIYGGSNVIEIPMKLSFENTAKKPWNLYQTVRKNFTKSCKKSIINQIKDLESYGRGIYWDNVKSHIYLCKNQHVESNRAACYTSKDNGIKWAALDLSVGSVLGHDVLNRDLYAVHRNQKLYLKFHSTYNTWLAITNEEFKNNVLANIDWKRLKTLDSYFDQEVTFGTHYWMGNDNGLYFRESTDGIWLQRAKWIV